MEYTSKNIYKEYLGLSENQAQDIIDEINLKAEETGQQFGMALAEGLKSALTVMTNNENDMDEEEKAKETNLDSNLVQ